MGIFIHLSVSKSVTEDEWASVYRETLRLVEAFPFAEMLEISVRGIKTVCLVPTKEREDRFGWHKGNVRTGWFTDGDYEYLCTAEDYFLPRDLVTKETYDPDAPDAMFGMLPAYLHYDWEDPRFQRCYQLWGNKTQGEPYHIYLLAVACLIESRLGSKACVYGDITKRQCRKAVALANQYLDTKIDLPDRCDPERFLTRIKAFPLSEPEILSIYTSLCLKEDGKFDVFTQVMEKGQAELERQSEQYDIVCSEDLLFYKAGDSIPPAIEEKVRHYFAFYRNVVNEDRFAELMERTPKERCEWLVFQNRSLLLRDRDWDMIFGNIMDKPETFSRYYPMVRVEISGDSLMNLIRAIVINDAFYKYLAGI